MDKTVTRNIVARAVLDTRLQSFDAQVEVFELGWLRVVCKHPKDAPRVELHLEKYRSEELFKDINLYAVTI